MALKPLTYEDPLYQLLREGTVQELNQRKTQGEKMDLTSCDFRYLDLRGLAAAGIDFTGCYFRAADLRGVDFSKACPAVASLNGARIFGAVGPKPPDGTNPHSSKTTSKRLLSANRLSPSGGAETSGCRTYRLLPDCR
jgi:Pentapeptide repeats (8 copies)